MVSYKVRHLNCPRTFLRFEVSLNLHFVLQVPEIDQKHIEMEHSIGGYHTSCKTKTTQPVFFSFFYRISAKREPIYRFPK